MTAPLLSFKWDGASRLSGAQTRCGRLALDPPRAKQDRPAGRRSRDAGWSQAGLVRTLSCRCVSVNAPCLSFPIKLTSGLIVWLKDVNPRCPLSAPGYEASAQPAEPNNLVPLVVPADFPEVSSSTPSTLLFPLVGDPQGNPLASSICISCMVFGPHHHYSGPQREGCQTGREL